MKKRKFSHFCVVCKYPWSSNLDSPKACPRCKRYDWQKLKGGIK